jgi:uncharacterized lipoprotein NlpE involved in copper resistance
MKRAVFIFLNLVVLSFWGCNSPQAEQEKSKSMPDTTSAPPDMHTSQIALDYFGTYKGVVPCADCEGIETLITLKENDEYEIAVRYLGKSDFVFRESGNFRWSDDGRDIILEGLENRATQYQVGENRLFQLDMNGKRITGNLAEKYILEKVE